MDASATLGLGFFVVLLYGVILGLIIACSYVIAKEFYSIALSKGYSEKKYLWFCFFFGVAGYLLVIALPNKTNKETNNM